MQNNLPIRQIAEELADRPAITTVSFSFFIAMLPHFFNLPLWITGFALFSLVWRIMQSRTGLKPVPKWLLVPLVLVGGLSVFAQYWTIVGREPGLALLTVMTSFKFLESRTHRDLLILVFLAYFLLATHFLFGQSIHMAAYMFFVLIIITATLISINQRDNSVSLEKRLKIAARLVGLSIPIMLILFVLVPRIPGPIWGLTQEQRGGVTGLSETMSPGQISDLITSNDVAFRVRFQGRTPPQQQLYWRGPVMTRFNGNTWFQGKHFMLRRLDLQQTADPISYTVTLEPHGKHWLFGLDIPTKILPGSYMSSEYQLTNKKLVNDLIRYSLDSRLSYHLAVNESLEYLQETTRYPGNSNPQTIALGKQWALEYDRDTDIINAALKMFRTEPYVYTLQPPLLGRNPTDEFLFKTRRGFCEHYASSFALLMRAAGIPARIVTGYQGGEINDVGEYLIVRQSDAHAWTEVWLEDRGWVRIDPTAAVSPDRIENGLDQALQDSSATFKIGKHNPFISQLMYNWDNLQDTWNAWVLHYDQQRQTRFLNSLGMGIKSAGDMIIAMVVLLIVVLGSYWLTSWYRERPPKPAEYEIILSRVFKRLARQGLQRNPAEELNQFHQRITDRNNRHDDKLKEIFNVYQRIKYGRGFHNESVIRRFKKMVSEWEISNSYSSTTQ